MIIKSGGQTERMGRPKVETLVVRGSCSGIELEINRSSLSYLSLNEAVALRDEIETAIKQSLRIN